MPHSFKELKHMTVAQLREIAAGMEDEAVKGYTQLNKDHLLEAICKALHIEMHEHHEVVGLDKGKIKAQIRQFKKERNQAIENKDYPKLISARKQIKKLKKELRKFMITT